MTKFTKKRGFALVETAVSLIAVTGIAMSINQQNTYKQEVTQAISSAQPWQQAVGEYYQKNGVLPTSNSQANMANQPVNKATKINQDIAPVFNINEFGDIVLTFNKDSANDQIANKTIILEPKIDEGKISWVCSQGSLENKFRPTNCMADEKSATPKSGQDLPDSVIDFVYKANLI